MNKSDVPYYKVAKEVLMNGEGLTEEEANDFIAQSSFEEIERRVGAEEPMRYAIQEFTELLIEDGEIAEAIEQMVFGQYDGTETMKDMIERDNLRLTDTDHYENAIEMLKEVHHGWVEDNSYNFFSSDKKIQYLPLEFIGWEQAKKYLIFVTPIIEAMGGKIDEKELEEYYKEFRVERGLSRGMLFDDLVRKIQRVDHPALSDQDDIIAALSDPEFISNSLKEDFYNAYRGDNNDMNSMSREELMNKLRTQEGELKTQEETIKELDRQIVLLKAAQEQK